MAADPTQLPLPFTEAEEDDEEAAFQERLARVLDEAGPYGRGGTTPHAGAPKAPRPPSPAGLVFAFGSNMDLAQMTQRVPGSDPVMRGKLHNYRFRFTGYSRSWGGSVATVEPLIGHFVPGVLYRVPEGGVDALDGFEGAPFMYRRRRVAVEVPGGSTLDAWVYQHTERSREFAPPSKLYLSAILDGAAHHGVTAAHVKAAARRAHAEYLKLPPAPKKEAR